MKFSFVEGGMLLNGPYVTVAPDLVATLSCMKSWRFSGVVKEITRGVCALGTNYTHRSIEP
jgi:hypothetical protein